MIVTGKGYDAVVRSACTARMDDLVYVCNGHGFDESYGKIT